MPFILLFFGGLGFLYLHSKKAAAAASSTPLTNPVAQPISWWAKQNYLQGQANKSPGYASEGEGSNIILQRQNDLLTNRVEADLMDRAAKTFDPAWKGRYLHALHRTRLQKDINAGNSPSGPVNIDRLTEEVNNDSGKASGFSRVQFSYQQRYTRGNPRIGAGPMPTRPLDQMDPGDQTAMQTTTNPNGFKSVIYPYNYEKFPFADLETTYWGPDGTAHNPGYTMTDKQFDKPAGIPLFDQIYRWFTGATRTGAPLPSRSNPNDNTIN